MSTDILELGKSGLFTSRKSLQTASHNIANVNTDGFSRQRAVQVTNNPVSSGNLIFGTGSKVRNVERIHDEHVEKQLTQNTAQHGYNTGRTDQLSNLENVYNEITTEGLNQILNKFFNSFRELSTNPESDTVRSLVRENAKIFIRDLKRAREGISQLVRNIDMSYQEIVNDVNSSLNEIAKLNIKIREIEASNNESGDLRDRRDQAIRTLSEFFSIDTYEDNHGKFTVNAKGIGTLVSGGVVQQLKLGNSNDQSLYPGTKEIFLESNLKHPVSYKFVHGKVAALNETKFNEMKLIIEKIDGLAWQTAHAVNSIHRKGFVNRSITIDSNGRIPVEGKITGIDFFYIPNEKHGAAEYIDLSNEVKQDLNNIVSAYSPNSPGDNRVAIAISKLQHERFAGDGTKTLEEDYLEGIGIVALTAGKFKIAMEQSESILSQTKAIKERISGVSIDEEASNMIKYQQAYEASARVIRVADEMFKTVLGLKT